MTFGHISDHLGLRPRNNLLKIRQDNPISYLSIISLRYFIINLVMQIQDSLDHEQLTYNLSGQFINKGTKNAMQTLYRQQLDELLLQKKQQKQLERNREMLERKQFNERANSNKQSEKIKDQAYKNYYNMLLNNQSKLQSSYVNPFADRDSLKDKLILDSIEHQSLKMQQMEVEEKRRDLERKNMYKSQLMHQIEERKRLEMNNKEEEQREKDYYKKYGKLPNEIQQYERQRHIQEMDKYRRDLDRARSEKESFRHRTANEHRNVPASDNLQHNTLINPLPYNIQNPYILRQMNKHSYLASLGSQNLVKKDDEA